MSSRDLAARPRWTSGAVVALALGAAGIVALSTAERGVAIAGDGAAYYSTAKSLAAGRGLIALDGEPYSSWPPLYPWILYLLERAGLSFVQAIRLTNLVCSFAIVVQSAHLARRATNSPYVVLATAALVASSTALYLQALMAQSELLFVVLFLALVELAIAYTRGARWSQLAALATVAALACLQRYIGVALVAAIGLLVLRHPPLLALPRRMVRAALFAAASLLPLSAWIARNVASVGEPFGRRPAAGGELVDQCKDAVGTVARWLVPLPRDIGIGWSFGLPILAAFAGLVWLRARRRDVDPEVWHALVLPPVVYVGVLLVSSATTRIDVISDRLLLPILPCVWILALLGLEVIARWKASRTAPLAVAAVVLVPLGASVRKLNEYVGKAVEAGPGGYENERWDGQTLVRWLREHPHSLVCYSNLADLVYLKTGATARFTRWGKKSAQRISRVVSDSGEPALLVWFQEDFRPSFPVEELAEACDVRTEHEGPDGMIVRIVPR